MVTPPLVLWLLAGAMVIACAGSVVLAVTRRGGPGATIAAVVWGGLAICCFAVAVVEASAS